MIRDNIKIIAFDADDTLWVNEPLFQNANKKFCEIFSDFDTQENLEKTLSHNEIANIKNYGYGIKSFVISMIETANDLCKDKLTSLHINQILDISNSMINHHPQLIDNIEESLKELSQKYPLIVITKGDIIDQERKYEKSGLKKYFQYIEVVAEKHSANYKTIFDKHNINPKELLMIGNSVKSDILPVLQLGAQAIHIPYKVTWEHEKVESNGEEFITLKNIVELIS